MAVSPDLTLPPVPLLLRRTQALAMLNPLLSPEWQDRFFSFDRHWALGQQLASIRDGSGNHAFVLFIGDGCILKTFDHERTPVQDSSLFLKDLALQLPELYQGFLQEPAFVIEDVTSVAWFDLTRGQWQVAFSDSQGVAAQPDEVLRLLKSGDLSECVAWVEDAYEVDVPLQSVRALYSHEPLTDRLVRSLNADLTLVDVMDDAREVGYAVDEPMPMALNRPLEL